MRSCFYYGHTVDSKSNTLRIDEGSGFIDVIVPTGKYALSKYINAVSNAINAAMVNDYIVSVDRSTRLVTISSTLPFSLLIDDISTISTAFPILGFTGANLTGLTSYTGNIPSGKAYYPQIPLQNLITFEHNKEYIDGAIKESPSGNVEVVSFGLKEYCEFNIDMITNIDVGHTNYIEFNATGYQDAVSFMDYCITKGQLEIMLDRADRNAYSIIMLESTASSQNGIGYKLKENFKALGIYETGNLKFRKI